MLAIFTYGLSTLLSCSARFFRGKFVGCAFCMSSPSTFAGDGALLLFWHSCKAAFALLSRFTLRSRSALTGHLGVIVHGSKSAVLVLVVRHCSTPSLYNR